MNWATESKPRRRRSIFKQNAPDYAVPELPATPAQVAVAEGGYRVNPSVVQPHETVPVGKTELEANDLTLRHELEVLKAQVGEDDKPEDWLSWPEFVDRLEEIRQQKDETYAHWEAGLKELEQELAIAQQDLDDATETDDPTRSAHLVANVQRLNHRLALEQRVMIDLEHPEAQLWLSLTAREELLKQLARERYPEMLRRIKAT